MKIQKKARFFDVDHRICKRDQFIVIIGEKPYTMLSEIQGWLVSNSKPINEGEKVLKCGSRQSNISWGINAVTCDKLVGCGEARTASMNEVVLHRKYVKVSMCCHVVDQSKS